MNIVQQQAKIDALTARAQALEQVLRRIEGHLGGGPVKPDWIRTIAHSGLNSTPAMNLAAHDAEVKREVVASLHPRVWTLKMQEAWHQAIPNIPKAFDDLFHAAGIEPSTDTPTQEPT